MGSVFDGVRDCAQNHPIAVAAGLTIALPGTYFFMTGKPPVLPSESIANISATLSEYTSQYPLDSPLRLSLPKWTNRAMSVYIIQTLKRAHEQLISHVVNMGVRIGLDERHLLQVWDKRWARLVAVAFIAALPGAFLLLVRNYPQSWTARHQIRIANSLHILALLAVGNQAISIQDMLVTALVMMSYEALEGGLKWRGKELENRYMKEMVGDAPCDSTQPTYHDSESVVETLLSQTHSVLAKSSISSFPKLYTPGKRTARMGENADTTIMGGSRDEEVERLRLVLTEARTALKAKEIETTRLNSELQTIRKTQNDTYAEYSSLREEMKSMKQSLGRDHQAAVYRKDIELFAMRKASEQKEHYIKDRESKLQDIYRSQKAVLELKDAQIRNLKERVTFLERDHNSRTDGEPSSDNANDSSSEGESHSATQVKFFRVQGRSSVEIERVDEEKDMEIARLRHDLSSATNAVEALNKTQEELKRAWDATFEAENSLNEERKRHAETQRKLLDAVKKAEEDLKTASPRGSLSALPTIDEQDKKELEAMFNTAQEDNLRLYTELESLEKRLQHSNTRVFQSEQEVETLKEQLRLEKAINEDLGSARPSLVHRVHFQRMEGQLKDSRDALEAKEEEVAHLRSVLASQDTEITELSKAKSDAEEACNKANQERADLQKFITQLQSTNDQLMLDHERLAKNRLRQRTTSAEHANSARSSGATLTTDASTVSTTTHDPPLPARPVPLTPIHTSSSIQHTPERHLRRDDVETNRLSLISNDVPPAELRSTRRRSLTLKGLMRKLASKDDNNAVATFTAASTNTKLEKLKPDKEKRRSLPPPSTRPKTAILPKDRTSTLERPKTAVAPIASASPSTTPTSYLTAKEGTETTSLMPPPLPPLSSLPFATTNTGAVTPAVTSGTIAFAASKSPPPVTKTEQEQVAKPKIAAPASVSAPAEDAHGGGRGMHMKSEGQKSSRYYEGFGEGVSRGEAAGRRPMTAVATAPTSKTVGNEKKKDENEKDKEKVKEQPKSRGWSVSKRLIRRSGPPVLS